MIVCIVKNGINYFGFGFGPKQIKSKIYREKSVAGSNEGEASLPLQNQD